jgi:hypothetical protein
VPLDLVREVIWDGDTWQTRMPNKGGGDWYVWEVGESVRRNARSHYSFFFHFSYFLVVILSCFISYVGFISSLVNLFYFLDFLCNPRKFAITTVFFFFFFYFYTQKILLVL